MRKMFQNALKVVYALVEQFVFYVAAFIAFLLWISLGNIYLSILVFIFICVLFWLIPSVIKRNK